ncbi:MAG: PQQ-dependent sugar dehydrogenase [Thaumarchaeota archaeon]|nr:PQQ-dependent sugar dehydrogenase [Candidatus Calditenuaceae archaeon]MDW8042898.1 PQQ-dependent sugar dehydrogenase [Nitrososphaerota archaeon]
MERREVSGALSRLSRRSFLVGAGAALLAGATYFGLRALTTPVAAPEGRGRADFDVETVAEGLEIPWSIAFLSGDEAVVTERPGRVRLLDLSSGRAELLGTVDVAHVGEGGLLGCSLLGRGPRLLVYRTSYAGQRLTNSVLLFDDLSLGDHVVLVSGIEAASIHNGGRVKVGLDGNVYATTGDAARPELSQRLDSLAGKVLRFRPDGSAPSDNPFRGSIVYSYGHRNPQGIAWSPKRGRLFATEHGPTGEFGRFAHDELNLIVPGGNYGWPHVIGVGRDPRFVDPVLESGDATWAPSGCAFCSGSELEALEGRLLFAALRGEALHAVALDAEEQSAASHEVLLRGALGRLRDVVQGPDGSVYLLTSNRDGRGRPRPGDDRVVRIVPRR